LALAFAREVEVIAAHGLAKGYERILLLRPPYRGKPDIPFHLGRLGGRPDRLAMRAKRITPDIPINRALSFALSILLRVTLPLQLSLRLHRLRPIFRPIRATRMGAAEIRRIPLTRLTGRYTAAQALAALLAGSEQLAFESAGWSGGSILFSMSRVWEGYVENWVRRLWPGHRVEAQQHFPLTSDGTLGAVADVLVYEGRTPVALYDAKYKPPEEAPKREDIYQMVTYCERLGLSKATLVYPGVLPEKTVHVAGKQIEVVGLDISSSRRPRSPITDGSDRPPPDLPSGPVASAGVAPG
jgi:5-methylcytosine-specific restriction endonuclease McrBC regulatory subunit McrC